VLGILFFLKFKLLWQSTRIT